MVPFKNRQLVALNVTNKVLVLIAPFRLACRNPTFNK
ncbi:unnamed protein product, partial [Urochloa humidicola]